MVLRRFSSALAAAALVSAAPVAAQVGKSAPLPAPERVEADSNLRGGLFLYGAIGVAVIIAIVLLLRSSGSDDEPPITP